MRPYARLLAAALLALSLAACESAQQDVNEAVDEAQQEVNEAGDELGSELTEP